MKKTLYYSMAVLLGTWFLTACGNEEMPFEKETPLVEEEVAVEPEEKDENRGTVASKAYEYSCPVTVTLETCGTLKSKILAIEAVDSTLSKVDQLIISGPLDANDVSVFLNEMTGLLSLDITETTFVENALTFKNNNYSTYTQLSLKENQIVDYMFYNAKLDEIKLPKGITSIGYHAFYGHYKSLISVTLPEGLKTIGNSAFQYNENLTDLVLPSSLETIGGYAFDGCHKLTINGLPASLNTIGEYAFDECSALKFEAFPESLTSIGQCAFRGCHALVSVVLPESLTSVGANAFRNCSGLKSVTWPKSLKELSNYVFEGCTKLSEVNLPEGVEKIYHNAFEGCVSLKTIKLPESLTFIGQSAFTESGLTSIAIPSKMTSISSSCVFEDCSSLATVVLPEGLESIGDRTFYNCDALTKVDFLPKSLTSLGTQVFHGCHALTEVKIPELVTELPEETFNRCSALTKVVLPKAMTKIGSYVFNQCYALTAVDFLPEYLTSIGNGAFDSCSGLVIAKIPDSVTDVGERIFYNCDALTDVTLSQSMTNISSSMFNGCGALKSIKMPESITSIESYAFEGCKTLEEVSFPSQITSIGGYAFRNCVKLVNVQLPMSLQTIGDYAFASTSPTEITFPESLTSIGIYAFQNTDLKSVTLPKITIGSHAFYECPYLTEATINSTYVPSYCFKDCKALEKVTMSAECKSIYKYAFQNTGITNLDFLPEGVESIGNYAFSDCPITTNVINFPSTVTSLYDYCLQGSYRTITSIYLPNTGNITVGKILGDGLGLNCLIYSKGNVTSSLLPNVVQNGTCLNLKLVEGSPFHCPEAFTANKVTFVKQFNLRNDYWSAIPVATQKGQASCWYGLSLPFTVKKITASDGRVFAPFNAGVEDAKPFWLRKLTPNGFENVTSIEAGEPYIIAFPNNESYADEYNVTGNITFTATSAPGNIITIPVTEDKTVNGWSFNMKTGYGLQPKSRNVALLNSPRFSDSSYSNYCSYDPYGMSANRTWGSTFVGDLRESWAFEPYVVGGSASYFSVNPSTNSRSASRTLGSVPQIDDM